MTLKYDAFINTVWNKAKLRDLITVTGLVIFPKSDSNQWFCALCDFKIWRMTWETTGNLLHTLRNYVCHFIAIHGLKFELPSENVQITAKSSTFSACLSLKFDRWPQETIWHLFYTTSSFVHHFKDRNAQFGSKFFCPVWPWNSWDDHEKQ